MSLPAEEEDILGGSAARPQPAAADVLGGAAAGTDAALPRPAPAAVADTLAGRLAEATRAGALAECPPAYADDTDWQTIRATADPFRVLYLDYRQHAAITDEQVRANGRVLGAFWESRLKLLIRGGDRLKARFGEGTIEQAPKALAKALQALADAAGRQAYFAKLENERRAAAAAALAASLADTLEVTVGVMQPQAIKKVLATGAQAGFAPPEAEDFLLAALRQAGLAPVKTATPAANPLLATWTPGGQPPAGQLRTKVQGQDVYSLAEAGKVLYDGFLAQNEATLRGLDDDAYLMDVASGLGENDVKLELKGLAERKLNKDRKRLTALYLLDPNLPYTPADRAVPPFESPAQLLARAAASAADFGAAEAAFKAGLLQCWLQASATGAVEAALPPNASPANCTALVFRRFLHQAAPAMPLWVGPEAFATPAALAAYIRRDENTWKMVYGSLEAGNLGPWLAALGQSPVLARQEQLAAALVGPSEGAVGAGPGISPADARRLLSVQALLEALDPQAPVPQPVPDAAAVDLTGLSGEALAERVVTFTNATGGPVRLSLALEPPLEGVRLSVPGLFFDQRAPGQRLAVALVGNPALMPRDGVHAGRLHVRTAYAAAEVPVRASAVFPQREFWQFVVGSGLALAALLGGGRYLLALALADTPAQTLLDRGGWVPLSQATDLTAAQSLPFLLALLALGGLLFGFGKVLAAKAKPRPAATA